MTAMLFLAAVNLVFSGVFVGVGKYGLALWPLAGAGWCLSSAL